MKSVGVHLHNYGICKQYRKYANGINQFKKWNNKSKKHKNPFYKAKVVRENII